MTNFTLKTWNCNDILNIIYLFIYLFILINCKVGFERDKNARMLFYSY